MTKEMYEDLLERNKLQISELNTLVEEQDKHIEKLEKENAKLKSECITCVYTDTPCVRSDYSSKNGVCDHYKNVFEENARLKLKLETLEGQIPWKDIKDKSEVIGKVIKAKGIIKDLLHALPKENIEGIYEVTEEAEQFLREMEKLRS